MKLTITVEDGPTPPIVSFSSGTPGAATTGGGIFGDKDIAMELAKQLETEQQHCEQYKRLAEETQAANQKLVEKLAKAKLEQRGWRLPKRGDKVRCVKEIPACEIGPNAAELVPSLGCASETNIVSCNICFRKDNKDGTFTDQWLPIEYFEPA